MILVSACLIGFKCRYDGRDKKNNDIVNFLKKRIYYPVCPEILGGLLIPREKAEIVSLSDFKSVKVTTLTGCDVTRKFINGAKRTLKIAKWLGCKSAIFKENSPSCGVYKIRRKGVLIDGAGVTSCLLRKNGIEVLSENNFIKVVFT